MISPRTLALKLEYHLFKKEHALLRRLVPVKLQAQLRRRARAKYLLWDAANYHLWMAEHLVRRKATYARKIEPGLLSIITPVWNGTPLPYLRALAESIHQQNAAGACEWVILNNGCRKHELLDYLDSLRRHTWVAIHDSAENTGIIGGLRLCLERATGRYILPVDSDDLLYPDCLQIVNSVIHQNDFPPLLYSDEDKLIGSQTVQPYLKPDFDPVLLLNSAYIAHLGVIDRQIALKIGAYSDKRTEGTPDWDLFVRFFVAGYSAVHIPEVIYSWRMHAESTAEDALSKPYIHSSQRAMLQRYLETTGFAEKYTIKYSPLLAKTADWWLERQHSGAWPAVLICLGSDSGKTVAVPDYPLLATASISMNKGAHALADLLDQQPGADDALVCLVSNDLEIDRQDYLWEAMALMERYPDTVMVGARIRNRGGTITSAGCVLGFEQECGCPDRGRPVVDPGYFTQVLKQRSVSAVSSQFAVLRRSFLRDVAAGLPAIASISLLGAWLGAYALRIGKRVVYSPFLSGVSDLDWDSLVAPDERTVFREMNDDLLPDHRFYPRYFGLSSRTAYRVETH